MSSLVIVAIPREDDLVWKVSSEKVPHLTLMYLGETENADHAGRMAEFVQHALNINEHGPFYLDVDYRGELGPDNADVLYFENGWDSKWIKSLRGQLLKQNDIRTAFDANDQYPEWVPHLTLGYPDAPAKPIPDEFGKFYHVCFDRVAVWIGDYEGPEFRLKWPERTEMEDLAVAYSACDDENTIADIVHFGVKGMRWGQRKEEPGGSVKIKRPKNNLSAGQIASVVAFGPIALLNRNIRDAADKNAIDQAHFRQDKSWEKNLKKSKDFGFDDEKFTKDYNDKWKDHDFSKEDWNNPSPKYKEYQDGYFKDMEKAYAQQVKDHFEGSSPSGKYEAVVTPGTTEVKVRLKETIQHAASLDLATFRIKLNNGLITGLEQVEDSMEQTAVRGEEHILEHFGVKGMQWGVRKEQLKAGAKAVGRALDKAATGLADADFENAATHPEERARMEIIDKADEAFVRTDLPKIKAKPEYVAASKLRNRLRHPKDPMTKQYRKEVKDTYIQRLESAANSMTNASGTREYTIRERGWELPAEGGALPTSKMYWEVSTRPRKGAAAHAGDNFEGTTTLEVLMDEDGFITGTKRLTAEEAAQTVPAVHSDIQTVHSALMQRVELGEQFIEHVGVKGMKWGQRKEQFRAGVHNRRVAAEAAKRESRPAQDVRAYPTIGGSKRAKAKVDTKGGFDHPPTEDAIKVESHRQKMKKSGVKALSNKDLQEVATRLNLENQVHQLESKQPKSLGKKFVDTILDNSDGGGGKKKKDNKPSLGGLAVKSLFKVAT